MFDSPQEVEQETLDALRTSMTTLASKAPDEADAYRSLVRETAAAVAEAKGGVTEAETAVMGKIEQALGSA